MKYLPKFLFKCSFLALLPFTAYGAGTYYTGNYQSPQVARYNQQYYSQTQRSRGVSAYNQARYGNSGYTATRSGTATGSQAQQSAQSASSTSRASSNNRAGFYLDAGLSRETSMWQFDMANAGSSLHYDNVDWTVFDANAKYIFEPGTVQVQIDAGFKYGMQSGDSTMIDDDITGGGYHIVEWQDEAGKYIADQYGHALSIGTSSGGDMLGFNVGVGLTDVFTWGRVKVTPSVGWRYLNYNLETEKNYGLAVDTLNTDGGCIEVNGEMQCDPVLVIYKLDGNGAIESQTLILRDNTEGGTGLIQLPADAGGQYVNNEGTYYYAQPGVSHSYDVTWSGPYLALDMLYEINQNNAVNARLELGLPAYTATGDQPYRYDWAHPKAVEDKAGVGSAFHFGMGANWSTAISDNVALSIGLTYDYYTVGDADATTYLNGAYYTAEYNSLLAQWEKEGLTESDMLDEKTGDPTALAIKKLEADCPGWVCKDEGEIESFYKSMGIRVGINARF